MLNVAAVRRLESNLVSFEQEIQLSTEEEVYRGGDMSNALSLDARETLLFMVGWICVISCFAVFPVRI